MLIIDPTAEFDYVLKRHQDLPEDVRPAWRLRGLTAEERAKLEDLAVVREGDVALMRQGTVRLEALRMGLRGFSNLENADGRPLEFEQQGKYAHPRTLDLIPDNWTYELVNQITERSSVSEEDSD